MQKDILITVVLTLLGISLMAYTSTFCRRMRLMGANFPRRTVEKILGGESAPEDVEEELGHLRNRLRAAGLALLALAVALLFSCLLLAWWMETSLRPLALAGLASLSLSLCLCAFLLRRNLTPA